jgi:phenylalanyl-tRNA synthetase alpha chain
VPKDHPSRKKSDCYYINKELLLRAHTSAHQSELIKQGMNNFLVVGDVYRRDEIDRSHNPIFHQMEGVRLCGLHEVFQDEKVAKELRVFDKGESSRSPGKQESHTIDAVMIMTQSLQTTLLKLVQHLFGSGE